MRESIGGVWITQLVIVFMFIFAAFLALSINYSKAFRIKNEVLTMIEKGEGLTQNTRNMIGNYLRNNGYTMKGKCEKNSYGITIKGVKNTEMELINDSNKNKKYHLCVSKFRSVSPNFPNRAYYEVRLFFKFNLPVLGNISTFEVEGQSKDVSYPLDVKNIKPKRKE